MPEFDDDIGSSVERIKKMLAKRDAGSHVHPRRKLHEQAHEVNRSWSDDELTAGGTLPDDNAQQTLEALQTGRLPDDDPLAEALHRAQQNPVPARTRTERRIASRLIKTLFIASALFFVFAAGIAAYFLLYSGRQVSCDNIVLDVRGPASIASGKELVLNVTVLNKNVVPIENAEVIFDYPEGTRSVDNSTAPLPSQREQLGTVASGERVRTNGHAILYGKEMSEQSITTRVQFAIKDSNASWECKQTYKVVLATAPVTVSVAGLEEISSGQELDLVLTLHSNSDEIVRNVRLVSTYPYGFDFLSADPKPTTKESVWDIGDVMPGTERTITIRGKANGYGTEGRSVDFAIGEASPSDDGELGVILQTVSHEYILTKPFLSTALTLNGSVNGDFSIPLGTPITGELTYLNDSGESLHNVQIQAKLPGVILDRKSVHVTDGYFRSVDGTMLWTPQTNDVLTTIEPGQSGSVMFRFATLPYVDNTAATNPSMTISFDVNAIRISDNKQIQQSLTAQAQRTINFVSDVNLSSYAVYSTGPFTNTGAHPPHIDAETTYTMVWRLENTTNKLTNVTVVGELPVNVSWLNKVSPSGESVSFNPVSRKVTWSIDELASGIGHQSPPRQVAFQIAVTPSVSQRGEEINLLESVAFNGVDAFTGTMVQRENPTVTTRLVNDPYFPSDDGRVRE